MTMPTPWAYCARALRVIDGDTLRVELDRGFGDTSKKRLRLLGVNAPETKGDSRLDGLAAKAFVCSWIGEQRDEWPLLVETVKSDDPDSFGRYLCRVWRTSDGALLNDDILAAGHAVPFRG